MKRSTHIQHMTHCVEALLGDKYIYLNEITRHFPYNHSNSTIHEYNTLEESTLSIFCILITWCHFEKEYVSLWEDELYRPYSITHLCEQTKQSDMLWTTLYTVYKKNCSTRRIPIFSAQFLHSDIHILLEQYAIPNDSLLNIIHHIQEILEAYCITRYNDISLLYEILCTYSLHRGEGVWIQSQLHKKYNGLYYTPEEIAQEMASYASTELISQIPIDTWHIIDTSCGTGNILLAFVEYISTQSHFPSHIIEEYSTTLSFLSEVFSRKEYTTAYKKRYCIDNIIYGVDNNPLALGICSYCLQYTSFITGMRCIDITHLRCANALFTYSYEQVCTQLSADEQSQFLSLHKQYKEALHTDDEPRRQELYTCLHRLYTKALCTHVAEQSKYTVQELFTIYTQHSIYYDLEFPEVFENTSGFLLSVGNPPWEKTKFEETLFIEQFYKGYTKEREEKKKEIRITTQDKYKYYTTYLKEKLEREIACYKALYPMSRGSGDDNLYRYFLEQQLNTLHKGMIREKGYIFYLIPTGFITEESSRTLRTYMMQHYSIHHIVNYENRNHIFPFVDSRYKFSILCIQHTKPTQESLSISSLPMFTQGIHTYKCITIAYSDIIFFSRGSYAIPELRTTDDSRILGAIYSLFPSLSEDYISVRRELDCASNRELFYSEYSDFATIPLYQGAMIWQYNSRYAPAKQYVSSHTLDTLLQSRELYRLYNDIYQCLPQHYKHTHRYLGKADAVCAFTGISRAEMILQYIPERTLPRFALRAIARNSDERSVICSLLPYNVTYQNSLFGSIAKRYILTENNEIHCIPTPLLRQLYSISIFNSLVYDWCMRFISAINISKAYLHKIPFPQRDENLLLCYPYTQLIENTCSLQVFHDPLLRELPLPTYKEIHSEEEAEYLQLENDCIVAHLYQLTKHDLELITSQHYFAVLHKKKKRYREKLLDMYT